MKKFPAAHKALSCFLSTLIGLNGHYIAFASESESTAEDILTGATIQFDNLSSGDSFQTTENTVYIDLPASEVQEYVEERALTLSSELSSQNIDHTINVTSGYGCKATICVTVTYNIDGYTTKQMSNFHASINTQGVIGGGGWYSGIDSEGPSPGAVAELSRLQNELAIAIHRLGLLKTQLQSKESQLNQALADANQAGWAMLAAGQQAQAAKQRMSNSKTEAERLQKEREQKEENKRNLEEKLDNLESQFNTMLDASDTLINDFLDEASENLSIDKTVDSVTKASTTQHNEYLADINETAQIHTALNSIHLDQALDEENNNFDLDEIPNHSFKTSQDHPKLEALRSTQRYVDAARERINTHSSNYKEQQLQLVNLAEIGIQMADHSYNNGENKRGDNFLSTALNLVDTAIDFTPGLSLAKDSISIMTGKNPITGETISDIDIAVMLGLLFVPAIATGAAKSVAKTAKALSKVAKGSEKASDQAEKLVDVIKRSDAALAEHSTKLPCVSVKPSRLLKWASLFFLTSTAFANTPCAKVGEITDQAIESAKNIRGKMSNLGEAIPGTTIPKYFRLKTDGAEFFVNPNATKHMGEYINSLPTSHGSPLRNDLILASFESGVQDAVKSGAWTTSLDTGNPIVSGGWELIFSKRPSDELVVIKHALMKK